MILDGILLRGTFESSLKSIHKHIEELLNIHLFKYISRIAFPIFESMAETFRTYILLFRFEKSSEQELKLIENILFFYILGRNTIIN
jgi:hypothetical protein